MKGQTASLARCQQSVFLGHHTLHNAPTRERFGLPEAERVVPTLEVLTILGVILGKHKLLCGGDVYGFL
jgi:hypothetical protein